MMKRLRLLASIAAVAILSGAACVDPRDVPVDAGSGGTVGNDGGSGGQIGDAAAVDRDAPMGSGGGGGNVGGGGDGGQIIDAPTQDVPAVDVPADGGGGKANGATCGAGGECTSGNCVEGVCCNSACAGKCSSCLMTSTGQSNGTCAPVKAGMAHANDCVAGLAATCGLDGKCDGAGACRFFDATTTCVAETCSDGAQSSSYQPKRTCDGRGACKAAAASDCSTYRCMGTACRTACDDNTQCTPAAYCTGGKCQAKKADGALCASGAECTKGVCGGRCCALGCTCTQPDPGNLIANAGFDQNITGWTATGGTLAWAGSDAENCPYSGCMRITLPPAAPEQTMHFCVRNTPVSGNFNFGIRVRPSLMASVLCQANFYADTNCAGDIVTQNETDSATASLNWTMLAAAVNSPAAFSVGMTCYLFSDPQNQSSIDFDMAYVSPAPKKF